jgi:hypothetical protein
VTTGGTYHSSQDLLAALSQVEIERAELRAEVERLRALLGEACDLADEAIAYVPEYFQNKWNLPATAARIRREGGVP